MFTKAKNTVIKEFEGICVGDSVRLIGIQMPTTVGKVESIDYDRFMCGPVKEIVFQVRLLNNFDYNKSEVWPIYRDELAKA